MSDHPRYQLLRPIGEGPLARVYLGHDRQARTDVAVKVLRDTVLRDGLRTAQLLDGAGVWAQLADEDRKWIFEGDKRHIHHLMLNVIKSHRLTVLLFYLMSSLFAFIFLKAFF